MISNIITDLFNVLIFDKSSIPPEEKNDFIELSGNLFLNKKLLDFYLQLKSQKQIQLIIFTSATITKDDELFKDYFAEFSNVFSTVSFGHSKNEPESFLLLYKKFGINLDNSFFIDDQENHITAARKAGLPAGQFISNQQIINKLKNLCQL